MNDRDGDGDALVAADAKFALFLEAVLNRGSVHQRREVCDRLRDVAATHPPDQAAIVHGWLDRLQAPRRARTG